MKKDLMKIIAEYPNKELFLIEWPNGFKIEAELDTLYETNNGLDENDPDYKEYHASLFNIKKVVSHSKESEQLKLSEGQLYEVSTEESPAKLSLLSNNKIVWENTR